MRSKILIFTFILVSFFAIWNLFKPSGVFAQSCQCSAWYCTCPCDVLCYPNINNCGCDAVLCTNQQVCDAIQCGGYDVYGNPNCCNKEVCTNNTCTGVCPGAYSPCINICTQPQPSSSPPPPPPTCPNGRCGSGESCSNCPNDCGQCPAPPGPTCGNGTCDAGESCPSCGDCGNCLVLPPSVVCGNLTCESGENCLNCSTDCGVCPAPQVGTIRVRAIKTDDPDTCTLTNPVALTGTTDVTISGPTGIIANIPATTSYSNFTNRGLGVYQVTQVSNYPPAYSYSRACINDVQSVTSGNTTTFELVFSNSSTWFQAVGGSIHSNKNITNHVPVGKTMLSTAIGYNSAIVSYSDVAPPSIGSGTISTSNYLVNDSKHVIPPTFSYYDYFYSKFASKTNVGSNTITIKPAPGIYEVPLTNNGNLSITSGSWDVTAGQSIIIFVPGALTFNLPVNNKITVREGGFLGFIAKGSISIANTVGYSSINYKSAPDPILDTHITGIFITNSLFSSLPTLGAQDNQLILAGSYIANKFLLQRSLDSANSTYPAELFIYRPDLWRFAPDGLKDIDITWKEISP